MAARENQGYLIAVIILVLMTLVLALAAFLGLSKASEYKDAGKVDAKKLYFSNKLVEANAAKAAVLGALIGAEGTTIAEVQTLMERLDHLATDTELDSDEQQQIQLIITQTKAVRDQYDADMVDSGDNAEGVAAPTPTYQERLGNLTTIVAKLVNDLNVQVLQTRQSEQVSKDEITRANNDLKISLDERNKLQEERVTENERALDLQNTLRVSAADANDLVEKTNKDYARFQTLTQTNIDGLKEQLSDAAEQNEINKTKINRLTKEVYVRPDGQVVKVASGLHSVFIDVGSADGLTNNRTFSIWDQGVTNFEKGKHKATIEVTNVSDYGAQARITGEDPTNPILPGDFILTPTWDPGVSIEFALAGEFDIDGDGFDDTAQLIAMISRNGGNVVVHHDANGDIDGTFDANIGFLIIGDPPKNQAGYNGIVAAMKTMEAQAEKNTVQKIDLQKLLSRMGVRSRKKIVPGDLPQGGFRRSPSTGTLKSTDH